MNKKQERWLNRLNRLDWYRRDDETERLFEKIPKELLTEEFLLAAVQVYGQPLFPLPKVFPARKTFEKPIL
ncbi:MAG: hypothetical protein FWG66_09725 [Spirochaetes bacterium]|nr:hypothetical protein [Spirochaetota bacterium]